MQKAAVIRASHYFGSIIHLILISILCSCASYTTRSSFAEKNWGSKKPAPNLILKLTMYLVGDAGTDSLDSKTLVSTDTAQVLKYLKTKLGTEKESSSILFLGDNIYPGGLPTPEDSVKRETAEFRLNSQLETLSKFKGRPIFVPGNHDWKMGSAGLNRQQEYVQNYLIRNAEISNNKDTFLPLNGCPGPKAVELNDNVVVIIVDSNWWLVNWKKEPKKNNACTIKDLDQFKSALTSLTQKYSEKNVVIAMHHPMYTYGPHGGHFNLKEHVFPVTELVPWAYLPLPGLGWFIRSVIGIPQDIANKKYKTMRRAVLAATENSQDLLFASGHEHTLQYIENRGNKYIVSGSASKNSPVGMGKGSIFSSSSMGFSTVSFYDGGETWVTYWEVSKGGKSATVIFQKKVKEKRSIQTKD